MTAQPGENQETKLTFTEKPNLLQQTKTDDSYALALLQPLLVNYPFLPFTHASLRPLCLAHMANDIVINGRKSIIEFGSGISTIIIGRLIKKNGLNSTLISIENNEQWVNAMTEILLREQLDDVVAIKWVPLRACKLVVDNNKWYGTKLLKEYTKNKKFDMVIIDGPTAWEPGKGLARYPAVPFISHQLQKNFSIYLDDANRPGEQQVIKTWETEYGISFKITGKSLAYYYGGRSFYTELFS